MTAACPPRFGFVLQDQNQIVCHFELELELETAVAIKAALPEGLAVPKKASAVARAKAQKRNANSIRKILKFVTKLLPTIQFGQILGLALQCLGNPLTEATESLMKHHAQLHANSRLQQDSKKL